MKYLLFTLSIIGMLLSCTPQTAGTVDDVGSISGQLLTKGGKPVDYTVTVALYMASTVTGAAFASLEKIGSNGQIRFRTIETGNGVYNFDSLPAGEYRIEVSEDDIVVAEEGGVTLVNNDARNDTVRVEEVMCLAFDIDAGQTSDLRIANSLIENCKITGSDSSYVLKTVKADRFAFKLVIQLPNLAIDTVSVSVSIDSAGTARYEAIDNPVAIPIVPADKGAKLPDTLHAGMKLIPAGTFTMGPDSTDYYDGKPKSISRRVTLTHDFWLDSTEVTQKEYAALMTATYPLFVNSLLPNWDSLGWGAGDNYPAHNINWIDAILYCNARTRAAGSTDTVYRYASMTPDSMNADRIVLNGLVIDIDKDGFHLPTEAQWEYACRAGTTTSWYFDSALVDQYAWHAGNSDLTAHPVAQKLPNAFGLYDMLGNVREWCNDLEWDYDTTMLTDPTGPASTPPMNRVQRGDDWSNPPAKSNTRLEYPFISRIPVSGLRTCLTVR